jgi:3-deoxy-D-manno-octulosonic-acid transferase
MLLAAYRRIRAADIHMVLIVVPRDPARAIDVCGIFRRAGLDAATLSQTKRQPGPSDVIVVDRIGWLRKLYALADVAFVGGSLVEAGGHNPLEPAAVAKPVLFGPHTDDFRLIYQTLENAGGAICVSNAAQLAQKVGELMANPKKRARVGHFARAVFDNHQGAVVRTLAVMEKTLEKG